MVKVKEPTIDKENNLKYLVVIVNTFKNKFYSLVYSQVELYNFVIND